MSEQPPPADSPSAEPPPGDPPAAPAVLDPSALLAAGTRRRRLRRGLLLAGAIVLIVLSAIAMLGLLGWNIGVDALVIGLAAAVVPVPVIVLAFVWLGRYEPEPVRYLLFCFTWGAFVATLAALGANSGAAALFERWEWPFALVPVVVAPVVEEIAKFAAPLLLWLLRGRRAVSGTTKGIVYCGLSAVGFAMVENILYLGGVGYRPAMDEFGPASGVAGLLTVFIVRILMSAFAHPLFTAAAGIGLGLAARSTSTAVRWLAPAGGLLAAMLLHATWNGTAMLVMATGEPLYFVYGYVAVMVPLFLGAVGCAVWLRSREGGLAQRTLPDYVRAGWLSPPEVASLATLATRYSARRWARRVAGEPGVRAMRRFQLAATRLALLRDHARRDPDDRSAAEEQTLLAEIGSARAGYVGRDPQTPPAHWDGARYEIAFPDGVRRTVPAPPEPAMPVPVPIAAAYPAYPAYAAYPAHPQHPAYPPPGQR